MLRAIRQRLHDREDGFTLIELMVVVLIIAILIAIALPTFLGAKSKAQDKQAQSSARNALTAGKTLFTDSQDYSTLTTGGTGNLHTAEPTLSFNDLNTASTGPTVVSVKQGSAVSTVLYLAVLSKSGKCFYVKDDLTATTGNGTTYASSTDACTGAQAPSETFNASW